MQVWERARQGSFLHDGRGVPVGSMTCFGSRLADTITMEWMDEGECGAGCGGKRCGGTLFRLGLVGLGEVDGWRRNSVPAGHQWQWGWGGGCRNSVPAGGGWRNGGQG
jgi:hypothetical protein